MHTGIRLMERINPRVDMAFKKIFGVEENKDLLISLINSIVSKEDQVLDITLMNPYNPQNFRNDKLSILDVKAKGHDGKLFNIEIQISDEADYDKRALYYWAKLYTEQLEQSVDYSTLSKAIGIHILNFKSIFESNKYHNVFRITEKDTGYVYFKDLELHTIELKKFCPSTQEDLSTFMDRVKNSLDMWMTFLTRHDLLRGDKMPKNLDDPRLKKAMDVLNVMNFTEEERMSYEDRLHWLRIEASALKKQMEKGLKKGMKKGEKIGMKKGEEIGIKKGREEGEKIGMEKGEKIGMEKGEKIGMEKAALDVARILKQQGVEPSIISLSTGLSVSVIENL